MDPKIILCCINHSTTPEKVTNESLHEIFNVFGNVIDVYIFSKSVQTKAFIKYESSESLNKAIEVLNNQKTPIGRLKTYISQKTEIIRRPNEQSDNVESFDFVKPEKKNVSQMSKLQTLPTMSISEQFYDNNQVKENLENSGPTTNSSPERAYQIPEFSERLKNVENIGCTGNSPQTELLFEKKHFAVNAILNRTNEDLNSYLPFDNQKSKVLIIQKLDFSFLKPKFIVNLFGCFGNVVQILVNKTVGYSLVEFQTCEQADNAFKSLNNLRFFGVQLKIKFSKYNCLSGKCLTSENQDLMFSQSDPKSFRYTPDHSIKVNEPSTLLHVTGIPDSVSPLILFQIVEQIHEPLKIVQLKKNSKGFRMYLLQFENLEQSLEVLSVLHNKQINEKFVKISFSHAKIE